METIAARMGKSYSHKFVIRHPTIKNFKAPVDLNSDIKLEDPDTYGLVKAENEDMESTSDLPNGGNNNAKKSQLPPVLNFETYKDVLEVVSNNRQFKELLEG